MLARKHGTPIKRVYKLKAKGLDMDSIAKQLAGGIAEHSGLNKLTEQAKEILASMQAEKAKTEAKQQVMDKFFNGAKLDFTKTISQSFFEENKQNGYK